MCYISHLMTLWLSAVLLAGGDIEAKTFNSFAGPYVVTVSRLYNCEGPITKQQSWWWYLRMTYYNPAKPQEPQRYTGNVTANVTLTDQSWLKIYVDQRSNNVWKENAYVFNFPNKGCSQLFRNCPYVKKFTGHLLQEKPCTLSSGVNVLNDLPVQFEHPNIPVIAYGHYRFRLMINKIGLTDPAACFLGECKVIPKL